MLILFDIDDTLAITTFRWQELTKEFMVARGYPTKSPLPYYGVERAFDIPEDKLPEYWKHMKECFPYKDLRLVPGMDRVIQFLITEGVDVRFITNRSQNCKAVTEAWITEKLGIDDPIIYFTSDNKVDHFLSKIPCSYLVDNSVNRCNIALKYNIVPILFTAIGTDNTNCYVMNDNIVTASTPADVIKTIKVGLSNSFINVGDYVKISNPYVFERHPKLPRELDGKLLKVIDTYRDPETNKLLRVNVTCKDVNNPKSKYNCFYLSGNSVRKVPNEAVKEITPFVTKEFIDNKLNNQYFVIITRCPGVKQIVPVHIYKEEEGSDWVIVKHQDKSKSILAVRKNRLFETEEEAYHYLKMEM